MNRSRLEILPFSSDPVLGSTSELGDEVGHSGSLGQEGGKLGKELAREGIRLGVLGPRAVGEGEVEETEE